MLSLNSRFEILPENIFVDKQSGSHFERPAYMRLVKKLRKGDLLVICSLEQWHHLTHKLMIDIVVLDMPLLDTRGRRDLLDTLISDLVLQLLSFVAQNERENIHQRQSEGIRAARLRGVKFGRPSKFLAGDRARAQIIQEWRAHRITAAQAGAALGVSRRTLYRWLDKGVLMQPNKQLK